jgi:crotonobetainyl-CoA:carnitine CoA-transferase CaiB-like acyl-CoA transferase
MMLSPYRVLDLTNERGQLCGQILGDLGADVILVEPPGGSRSRCAPFYKDEPHPNRSLYFWAFNRNKRGITLDLDNADDCGKLKRLVPGADFLIESETPGYLSELGLGYRDLSAINPALLYISISAFGQKGPKAKYAESDLTVTAAGGPLLLTGDADRPPVRITSPQAYLHASADAAAAALIAHQERVRSGLGQYIDVSAQQAVAMSAFSQPLVAGLKASAVRRAGGGAKAGPIDIRQVWPARDGYVVLVLWFGAAIGLATSRLMQCVYEHGFCSLEMRDRDWTTYDSRLIKGEVPLAEYGQLKSTIERFTRSLTKAELLKLALERALLIAPVATIDEVRASPQLAARDYWPAMTHQDICAEIRYPGPFAKFSETPIIYRRRPPNVGEHNQEVLSADMTTLSRRETVKSSSKADDLPLKGLKILDLFWAMAGPASTRALAEYGATVVRVESRRRLDTCRTIAPYVGNQPGIENSGIFINLNVNKLGITLDLGNEEGKQVLRDLVRWADIVAESFSPKAMRAWGLDYEALRQIKPDIIMVSSCLMGQTGPYSKFAGYGALAAAMCGFGNLCGWPDRPPTGPYGSYTDCVAPRFTICSILAALEHRRRTGRGQYIEISQSEASMHFLGPVILDFVANGRVQGPAGNRDMHMAPHSVYPCAADDSWIAIACVTENQWRTLSDLMGRPELARDSRFATLDARMLNQDALDSIVADWTSSFDATELESKLQSSRIPASKAATSDDMYRDPQLAYRGHFIEVDHPQAGKIPVEASGYIMSRTPGKIERVSPTLGRDNEYVLEEILGYSAGRIRALGERGVLK